MQRPSLERAVGTDSVYRVPRCGYRQAGKHDQNGNRIRAHGTQRYLAAFGHRARSDHKRHEREQNVDGLDAEQANGVGCGPHFRTRGCSRNQNQTQHRLHKKEELADEHGALRFALRLEINEGDDDAHGARNDGGDVEIDLPAHIVVYAHCTPPANSEITGTADVRPRGIHAGCMRQKKCNWLPS